MNLIIDSIMGSGKTTWAIHCMNNHPEKSLSSPRRFCKKMRASKAAAHH